MSAGANTFLTNLIPLLQSKPGVNLGSVSLTRQDQQVNLGGTSSEIISDRAKATFASFNTADVLAAPELSGGYVTNGYCATYTFSGNNGAAGPQIPVANFHDAGSLTVTGSNGAKPVALNDTGRYEDILGARNSCAVSLSRRLYRGRRRRG